MMKKVLAIFLMSMFCIISVYGQDMDGVYFKKVSFAAKSNVYYIEEEGFEGEHCPYMLEDGMLMVPLREIFDTMEKGRERYEISPSQITWDEKAKRIVCQQEQRVVWISIDNTDSVLLNGVEKVLDYSLVNRDGVIYISLRDVAFLLGNHADFISYDVMTNRFGFRVS